MALNPNYPLPIQIALTSLSNFIASIRYARPGCIRAMRPERQESIAILLDLFIRSTSLQHDGAIVVLNGDFVRPMTVDVMVNQTGMSRSKIVRSLEVLGECGYLESRQIKRRNKDTGQLEVSPGLRFLTKKFWEEIGLLEIFAQSVDWAKKHCKRKFLMPFRKIKKFFSSTASNAKGVVKEVLQGLSEDSKRVKSHCNEILTMLRKQRK